MGNKPFEKLYKWVLSLSVTHPTEALTVERVLNECNIIIKMFLCWFYNLLCRNTTPASPTLSTCIVKTLEFLLIDGNKVHLHRKAFKWSQMTNENEQCNI